MVEDATQKVVWRWDQQEPFGDSVADENPSALGTFDLPLRLPGQYIDSETNLSYNIGRDYSSEMGRYVESDLIGLSADLNTYAYGDADPLRYSDLVGLLKKVLRHDFQLWEGSIILGSQKGKTRRKGHWEIYAMVPECFVELDERIDKYDVGPNARPSPSIGGKNPMVTIYWQWVVHTEYQWGPRPTDTCCKGSETFGGYSYDDGGLLNYILDAIDALTR